MYFICQLSLSILLVFVCWVWVKIFSVSSHNISWYSVSKYFLKATQVGAFLDHTANLVKKTVSSAQHMKSFQYYHHHEYEQQHYHQLCQYHHHPKQQETTTTQCQCLNEFQEFLHECELPYFIKWNVDLIPNCTLVSLESLGYRMLTDISGGPQLVLGIKSQLSPAHQPPTVCGAQHVTDLFRCVLRVGAIMSH